MKNKNEPKSLSEVWGIKNSAMQETAGLSLSDTILKRIKDSVKGNGQVFLDRKFHTIGVIC